MGAMKVVGGEVTLGFAGVPVFCASGSLSSGPFGGGEDRVLGV